MQKAECWQRIGVPIHRFADWDYQYVPPSGVGDTCNTRVLYLENGNTDSSAVIDDPSRTLELPLLLLEYRTQILCTGLPVLNFSFVCLIRGVKENPLAVFFLPLP